MWCVFLTGKIYTVASGFERIVANCHPPISAQSDSFRLTIAPASSDTIAQLHVFVTVQISSYAFDFLVNARATKSSSRNGAL